MRKLLVATTLLIIYGSLYPFNFSLDVYDSSILPRLFYFGLGRTGGGDLVANVILFVPFGFFAIQSVKGRVSWKNWVVILGAAFILAHAIQILQLFVPKRVPSGSDSLLNVIGCALGCMCGSILTPRRIDSPRISTGPLPIPTLLAVVLIAWNLRPFIPSLDLGLLADNLKHLISSPLPHPVWTFQAVVTWLIIFHFLEGGEVKLIPEKSYPALLALTVGASIFIVGNSITIDRIVGAFLVLPIWAVMRGLQRPPLLVFLTFVLIVGISFTPFELRDEPINFSWIPFSGALGGNLFINVMATIKKMLLYGSLIYLLVETNVRLWVSTLIVSVFLFFSEFLQVFFQGRTPEITDSILALMIGTGFYIWEDYRKKTAVSELGNGSPSFTDNETFNAHPPGRKPPGTAVSEAVPSNHIPAMDGLRAVAALAVFFVHFNQQVGFEAIVGPFDLDRFLANGNTGVALFFTLSGLLLSIPFWQAKLSAGEFPNIRSYAWRRAARIIPAYYFCLLAIVLAHSLVGGSADWFNIFSHLTFAYNFSDRNILSFNPPFWTLAVEVQFYLLLPLLFLALRKVRGMTTFWLILALVPFIYLANYLLVEFLREKSVWPLRQTLIWPFSFYLRGPDSSVLTYSTLAHLPHFLIGVLGARVFLVLSERNAVAGHWRARCEGVFWLCALGVFLILSTSLDDRLQVPSGRYNFPFVPLLLVGIVVSVPFTRIARRILDFTWVRWLGCVSYGIYIYHYPVQKLVSRFMSMADLKAAVYPLFFGFVSLAVTLFIAYFSYNWLEIPVMRWVRRRLGRPLAPSGQKQADDGPVFENSSKPPDRTQETVEFEAGMGYKNSIMTDTDTNTNTDNQPIPESRHEVVVNLRRSQARFLQHLAEATNLDLSGVCQWLIGLATRPKVAWQHDTLYSAIVEEGLKPFHREPRDRSWTRVSIYLEADHFDALASYASDPDASNSNTMRHLLTDCMEQFDIHSGAGKGAGSRSKRRFVPKSKSYSAIAIVALLAVVMFILYIGLKKDPSVEVGPHWAGASASLVFDPHTHTRHSGGKLSSADLVKMAVDNGCDALAITDHSNKGGTVSDEQMLELQDLRDIYPDLLLFSGIELNMPSYGGREHAGLIAGPSVEVTTLQQLRDVAERSLRRARNAAGSKASDMQVLQMIADYQSLSNSMLLIYNHPSRKDPDIAENLSDLTQWNAHSPVFSVIEGAPGHQNAPVTGSYLEPYLTEDGWDRVVAEVGGVWDELFSQGHQLWGALASSDYHRDSLDKAPCAFARTHLIVPEWSYRGAFRALKMGTFWADHGRILNQLWFSVSVDGLEQAAYPGFVVYVGDRDSQAVVTLSIERGPGSMGQPLTVEIIGNCNSGDAEILAVQEIAPSDSTFTTLVPLTSTGRDDMSCSLRARVRLIRTPSADYLAYTNPVRLILD